MTLPLRGKQRGNPIKRVLEDTTFGSGSSPAKPQNKKLKSVGSRCDPSTCSSSLQKRRLDGVELDDRLEQVRDTNRHMAYRINESDMSVGMFESMTLMVGPPWASSTSVRSDDAGTSSSNFPPSLFSDREPFSIAASSSPASIKASNSRTLSAAPSTDAVVPIISSDASAEDTGVSDDAVVPNYLPPEDSSQFRVVKK